MKKSTLQTVYAILLGNMVSDEAKTEALTDITTEMNLTAERKRAKLAIYEKAHDVVMDALYNYGAMTAKDLFEQIASEVPAGFTANNLQYGLNHIWKDELTINTSVSPHTYSL